MRPLHRWWLAGALTLMLVAAALTVQLVAASGNAARSGRLVVVRRAVAPPAREVRGDVLVTPGAPAQKLGGVAAAPLVGHEGPVAAVSPDGRTLAYNSFHWNRAIDWRKSFAEEGIATGDALGVPTLRLRDLTTGRETALEPGSQSLAWRADGALAYTVGDPPAYRANLPFLANVVVRAAPSAAPVQWSPAAGRYRVAGWAGGTLLAQRDDLDSTPDLVAFDGPGAPRTLAPTSFLLAISPDGADALIATTPAEAEHPAVRLLRVSDGAELARLPIADAHDPVTGDPVAWVLPAGSWSGDRVLAAAEPGLVVFRVGASSISVEQVLHLDSATKPNGVLYEPRFASDDTRTIVAWSGVPGTEPNVQAAQLSCDRFALRCTRSAPVDPTQIPRPVYDLSGGTR